MSKGLASAVGQLEHQLPVESAVRILGRFLELFRAGRTTAEPAEVRRGIGRYVSQYRKWRTQCMPEQIAKFEAALAQVEAFKNEFDEGSLLLRLRINIGRADDATEVEFEGKTMMKCEAACHALAREAAREPGLVTSEVLAVANRGESFMAYAFLGPGEYDVDLAFLPAIEALAVKGGADRMLALYLHGVRRRDPALADARFESLAENIALPRTAILEVINHFGSTPGNRQRVLR